MLVVETRHGPARAHVHRVREPRGLIVLGHGAGGGVAAPDLAAATRAAVDLGIAAVLVEQPYRVAGRRSPAPAPQLDAAWVDVVEQVRDDAGVRAPLIAGGRSSGARVACRTAAEVGAAGVVCLAFPLRPPGRPDASSRLPELELVRVPTLVVQGERDAFGLPPATRSRTVARVRGDHSLKSDVAAVREAVAAWLAVLVG
jgi:uncharacterized protein